MTKKAKKNFFSVVAQREYEEVQSEFEEDLYMVQHRTKKGVVYWVYFTPEGVSVHVSDGVCKQNEEYQLVLEPLPLTTSYPGVDISVKRID
jgi:hypothetical protein